MKTAIFALVIWLGLAALADPSRLRPTLGGGPRWARRGRSSR